MEVILLWCDAHRLPYDKSQILQAHTRERVQANPGAINTNVYYELLSKGYPWCWSHRLDC